MFCPKCGSEYRAGFQECADCAVPLVESVPASSQPGHHDVQLATVFASGDPALIALARSLLDAAEIPFTTKGEGIQDLFGWGRMPGSYSVVAGPVEFQVNEEDVADARALLEDLHESNQDSVEIDSEPEDDVYKPLGSTTCPACGMPYNLSDYRADAPKIFCSHCRTELPRSLENGSWTSATLEVEKRTRAVEHGRLVEDLGIETLGAVFTPLLDRGQTVPCEVTETFSTAADNQDQIEIRLFRGTAKLAWDATPLGRFVIEGLPKRPRGMANVAVTFSVTTGGDIIITARADSDHAVRLRRTGYQAQLPL